MPIPYPTASAKPDRSPWATTVLGSNEGVTEAAKNKAANTRPTKEKEFQYRCHQFLNAAQTFCRVILIRES
jgi:hypothetical protein